MCQPSVTPGGLPQVMGIQSFACFHINFLFPMSDAATYLTLRRCQTSKIFDIPAGTEMFGLLGWGEAFFSGNVDRGNKIFRAICVRPSVGQRSHA